MAYQMAYQSLLAKIMATARDRSAAMMRRFLESGGDVACDFDSDDDDDEDDNILHFDLRAPTVLLNSGNRVAQVAARDAAPVPPKKSRSKYPRKDQKDSLWWRDYLANAPPCRPYTPPPRKIGRNISPRFSRTFRVISRLGAAYQG